MCAIRTDVVRGIDFVRLLLRDRWANLAFTRTTVYIGEPLTVSYKVIGQEAKPMTGPKLSAEC